MTKISKAATAAAVTAVLAASSWVPSAAAAPKVKPTTCKFEGMTIVFDPGLSVAKGSGKLRSAGSGTATCDGTVHGASITGPGVWSGSVGTFTGSCAGGDGEFTMQFQVPTSNGKVALVNKGTYTFGPLKGGVIGGEYRGNIASGTLSAAPAKGNCVTTPLTEVLVGGDGTFH